MEFEANDGNMDTRGPQTPSTGQDKAQKRRWLLGMAVSLGIICVFLLLFMTLRGRQQEDLGCKDALEVFNETLNHLMIEKVQLQARVRNLTAANGQMQQSVESLSLKMLELEIELRNLSVWDIGTVFVSSEAKSWSESRQYCRDHGGDLVIIKSKMKQRFMTSMSKEFMWIGLSDIESEGKMKWVDNSPLDQGFWLGGEPNDAGGNEDCIELMPEIPFLNNWNDRPCSARRKGICEK